jgi:hypothetical protein
MASVFDTPEFLWSLLVAHQNCLMVTTMSVHWNSLQAHSHCCSTLKFPFFADHFLAFPLLHLVILIFHLLLPLFPTAWPLIVAIAIFGFMPSLHLLLASAATCFYRLSLIIGHIISCFHYHISSSIFPFLIFLLALGHHFSPFAQDLLVEAF